MITLTYSTVIHAPAEKVFQTMLGLNDRKTYEEWTAIFNPTSTYEGTWEKGSKMYFIGLDEEGNRGGMVSEIADHVPNEFISIRHYGILKGDEEITEGEAVESWAGGLENYKFEAVNGDTKVSIECDTLADYKDYFDNIWPKALTKLKELVEKDN